MSTDNYKKFELVINDLRTIFTRIQIRDENKNLEDLISGFIGITNFRLKNILCLLLRINEENTNRLISKILEILDYYIRENDNFNWEEFDKKIQELEGFGNDSGFVFYLGSDLKSIFLIKYETKEMNATITKIYENLEKLSREVPETNVHLINSYFYRIKNNLGRFLFLVFNFNQISENLDKRDFYNMYMNLELVYKCYLEDTKIPSSVEEFMEHFFEKYGGILIGEVSIGFIIVECCFNHLLYYED